MGVVSCGWRNGGVFIGLLPRLLQSEFQRSEMSHFPAQQMIVDLLYVYWAGQSNHVTVDLMSETSVPALRY